MMSFPSVKWINFSHLMDYAPQIHTPLIAGIASTHGMKTPTFFLPSPPPLNVRPLFSSLVLEFFFTLQSLSWRKKSETSLCILFLLLKRNGGRGMIHVLYSVLFRIEASVSGERPALKALYLKHLFWNSSFLFRDAHGFDICRLATMEGQ